MRRRGKSGIWIRVGVISLLFLTWIVFREAVISQGAVAEETDQEQDRSPSVPEPDESAVPENEIVWEERDVYGTPLDGKAQTGNVVTIPYGTLYQEEGGLRNHNYRIPVDKKASGVSDGDIYVYEVTDEEGAPLQDPPYRVDENGIVSFLRAMEEEERVFVRVRRKSGVEGYGEAAAVIELRVTPRKLLVDTENTAFEAVKTYDGTSDTGNVRITLREQPVFRDAGGEDELLAELLAEEEITAALTGGTLDSQGVDAGVYQDQKVRNVRMTLQGAKSGNYCLEMPGEIYGVYTILPREYRIRITGGNREYGTREYITEPALSREERETNFLDHLDEQSRADNDFRRIQECIRLHDDSTETSPMERLRGDRSNRYISAEILCEDAGNYTIVSDGESQGELVITEETIAPEEVMSRILLEGSENYVFAEGQIWLKGEYDDTPGKLKISSGEKSKYNTVTVIRDPDYRIWENTEDTVSVPVREGEKRESVVRFKLQNRDEQGITAETGEIRLPINVDSQKPEALITEPEEIPLLSLESLDGAVGSGIYKNTGYEVKAKVTDKGAGTAAWSYAVLEDTGENLTAGEIREYGERGELLWRSGTEDGRIAVCEGDIRPNGNDILENRVILIRADDKVGNSAIYTSMGVIIENYQPQVEIAGLETYIRISCDDPEGRTPFRLTVSDKAEGGEDRKTAGISSITAQICGEQDEGILLRKSDGQPAQWKEQELTEELLFIPSAEYIKQKGLKTDRLRLVVSAADKAGNKIQETKQLVMDTVPPSWKWEFEGTSFSQDADTGKKYTRDPVSVKVTVNEKNFDPDQTVLTIERDETRQDIRFSDAESGMLSLAGDTEAGYSENEYTDNRVLTYILRFPEEGDYTLSLRVKDKCGNAAGEGEPLAFVIDQTAPEVSITFEENQSLRNETYFRSPRTAVIVFRDRNPDMENMGIALDTEDFAGKDLGEGNAYTLRMLKQRVGTGALFSVVSCEDSADEESGEQCMDERTVTVKVQFHPDAVYTVREIFCRDLAGNRAESPRYDGQKPYRKFTVDCQEPEGTVELSAGNSLWKNLWSAVTFGLFSNREREKITITASDAVSPVERIQYVVLPEIISTEEEFAEREEAGEFDRLWKQWTGSGDSNELTGSFTRSPNERAAVYTKLTDAAGNVRYISSDGFVLDDAEPVWDEITVLDINRTKSGIFNGDVSLRVRVRDPGIQEDGGASEMICSGLRDVYYIVKDIHDAGREDIYYILRDGQLADGDQENGNKHASARIVRDAYREFQEDGTMGIRSLEASITVPAWNGENGYNSNGLYVELFAADHAGNLISADTDGGRRIKFSIDTTVPAVSVSYDKNDPANGRYFKENRQAMISFRERNFDPSGVEMDLTAEGIRYTDTLENLMKADIVDFQGKAAVDFAWEYDPASTEIPMREYTDSRISRLCITFKGNASYELHSVSVTDAADNTYTACVQDLKETRRQISDCDPGTFTTPEGTQAPLSFVVDKILPEISVKYTGSKESAVHSGYYFKELTADFTVNEHNFDQRVETPEFVITSRDLEGNQIEGHTVKDASWTSKGDIRTYAIQFQGDANYTWEASYTDLAGNTLKTRQADTFTVDKSAPGTAAIDIKEHGIWRKLVSVITFGLFDDHAVQVSLYGQDGNDGKGGGTQEPAVSPVEPLQYYKGTGQMTRAQLDALPPSAWITGNSLTVNPDQKFVIYLKVTNYAGLTSYFSSDGVVADSTEPVPGITITNMSQARNGIFRENVLLRIDVKEPAEDEIYAGLKKVWYRIWSQENSRASEERVILDNTGHKAQGDKNFSYILEVDGDTFNSNDVRVQVFAEDMAGNEAESQITQLKIDVTAPSVTVSWDRNDPMNGRYYKDTRTAVVTVKDRNFDPEQVRFTITGTGGASPYISGWSGSSDAGISDQAVSTCQVSFPEDGDYTFTLECTDLAGNSGGYGHTEEFTIDKTLPRIQVAYGNSSAVSEGYYNQERKAVITITERNFNPSDVKTAITASLEGRGISAPSVSGFSGKGDVHTAVVSYDADGDYTFDIEYADLAGNAAEDYRPDSFTVDLTAPELEIFDIEDRSANNDVVAPGIRYSDANCDRESLFIALEGIHNGAVDLERDITFFDGGQSIKFHDFPRKEEMDDLYRLTAGIKDLAGNETEKTVLFSVNRYGSVYVLDQATAAWLSPKPDDSTCIRQERRVGVQEYNVDEIQEYSITVNRDGELTVLEENMDFAVRKSGDGTQWKVCHYIINAENFSMEGNYRITISSRDTAENSMTNETVKKGEGKRLPLSFTIDKTAPTVVVSGIRDGGQYRASSRTLTIDAKDNIALERVSVTIGNRRRTYEAKELRESEGIIETEIFGAANWQKVEITAEDAAGNQLGQKKPGGKAEPVVMTVLVTPSVMIQYFMNKPVFYGSLILLIFLAAAVILMKRRSRNR